MIHSDSNVYEAILTEFGLAGKGAAGKAIANVGVAIVKAESGGDSEASNLGGDVLGPWQIRRSAHRVELQAAMRNTGIKDEISCQKDLGCSTKAAALISKNGTDWSAWNASKPKWSKSVKDNKLPSADSGFLGTGIGSPSGLPNPLEAVGKLIGALMDPHTWIRVVEVIGGAVLMLMAMKELTGGSVDPIGAARKVVPV
jgi:hypothetical protein